MNVFVELIMMFLTNICCTKPCDLADDEDSILSIEVVVPKHMAV